MLDLNAYKLSKIKPFDCEVFPTILKTLSLYTKNEMKV